MRELRSFTLIAMRQSQTTKYIYHIKEGKGVQLRVAVEPSSSACPVGQTQRRQCAVYDRFVRTTQPTEGDQLSMTPICRKKANSKPMGPSAVP